MHLILLLILTATLNCSLPLKNDSTSDNPLEPCPETPNCERESKELAKPVSAVHAATLAVLKAMNAEKTEQKDDDIIHAVFRIPIFGFRDDVHIALKAAPDESTMLHIRSASRTGHSDLGVNRRRVARFFKMLDDEMSGITK